MRALTPGLTPVVIRGVLGLHERVERALGINDKTRSARQTHLDVRPAAAFVGVERDLLIEVEPIGQARGLQHIAQHLLAPAALDAGSAAKSSRQLSGFFLGRD